MRQKVAKLVEHVDHQLEGFGRAPKAKMHVHAEDQHAARGILHFGRQVVVARTLADELLRPARERVRRGGDDAAPGLLGDLAYRAAQAGDLRARLVDIAADLAADLDLRLHKFRLELVAQHHAALLSICWMMRWSARGGADR